MHELKLKSVHLHPAADEQNATTNDDYDEEYKPRTRKLTVICHQHSYLPWIILRYSSLSLFRYSMRDWRTLIMAWALITSIFKVSLSIETLRISFSRLLMNFRYPGGTDFSRLEASNVSVLLEWFSLFPIESNNGNSKRVHFVDGATTSWLVVVESSEDGSLCFDLLNSNIGTVSWSASLFKGQSSVRSLLQPKGIPRGSTGISLGETEVLFASCINWCIIKGNYFSC